MERSNPIKSLILVLAGIAFLGFQQEVFSQKSSGEFIVTGKVNNPQGEKAVGARILVKGTSIGTVTDTSGFFTIKVPSDQAILVISHLSTSKSAEVALKGSSKIVVKLASDTEIPSSVAVSKKENQLFDKVEVMPRPKEGEDGWNAFLAKNMKYPANDRASDIEGTVIVGFEVHEDGSLQNFEILRGIGGECDEEVLRVMAAGPAWQPGMINGEAVKTRMSLPVRFILKKEDSMTTYHQTTEKTIAEQYGKNYLVVIGYQPRASLK